MLVECSNCGAPLDVKQGARTAKCGYCGRTNQVRSARTLAMQAPQGWQPPQTWTPPQQFPAESVPLQYTPQQARGARTLVFVIVGVVLVIGLIPAIVVPMVISSTTESIERTVTFQGGGQNVPQPNAPHIPNMPNVNVGMGGGGVTNQPIECQGSGMVVRTNENIQVSGGHAVLATGSCTVRLINCSLRGGGITVSDQAEVEMTNGSVGATDSSLTASGSSRVRLVNVEASGGVVASGNANVTLLNGSLSSQGKAIDATGGARVSTQNTHVTGSVAREASATVTIDGEEQPAG